MNNAREMKRLTIRPFDRVHVTVTEGRTGVVVTDCEGEVMGFPSDGHDWTTGTLLLRQQPHHDSLVIPLTRPVRRNEFGIPFMIIDKRHRPEYPTHVVQITMLKRYAQSGHRGSGSHAG